MHKRLMALCAAAILGCFASVSTASAASFSFDGAMRSAALARQVPLPIIQAIAYVNTHWEVINHPALDHGYLPMDIKPSQVNQAAVLGGHSPAQVETDPTANIDAAAALLAHSHTTGADLASWQPAVASLVGPYVAVEVFQVLREGASRTTTAGESITLTPQLLPAGSSVAGQAAATAPTVSSSDYPPAAWVPASPDNYSVADRPNDFPVDMIIIHDIEGSYGSAIQEFQNGATQASAHYVVSAAGQVTQMVAEHNIAWHAGNWDYNTRAIGIEHEGFACCFYYTDAEYQASASLAGSICSRWGVPMDRTHVIGHYQVPDPNNPGQFGGAGHHTDPGATWDWPLYMRYALAAANSLPSPPHLVGEVLTTRSGNSTSVSWQPARTCHAAITGYTVVAQPGGATQNLSGGATTATFSGLQSGTTYTFTVTAHDSDGDASLSSKIGPWVGKDNLGGPIGYGAAVASWSSNRLDAFFEGTDGLLYHEASTGSGWSSPDALGGSLSSPPAAVSWGPNRIDVFARGSDGQLWHRGWYGTYWGDWAPLGGGLASAPTVSSWAPGRLDVFVRGTDNQLWHKGWYGTTWGPWQPLGGALASAPAAVSWSANRIDVFVTATDLQLWHRAWSGSSWSAWNAQGGSLASAPAVSSWGAGRLDVYALTSASTLQHNSYNGSAWSGWAWLGGETWQGDPASVSRSPGSVDVLASDPQSTLFHLAVTAS